MGDKLPDEVKRTYGPRKDFVGILFKMPLPGVYKLREEKIDSPANSSLPR